MDRKVAGFVFLGACVVLALLLLTQVITPVISAALFAIALAVLGGASAGFRKRRGSA